MHVALIIDEERLLREPAMLKRVSTGLSEEGIQITAILPEPAAPADQVTEPPLVVDTELSARMQVPPWMRRLRARRLADLLSAAPPDVLHAVGDDAWTLALDVARVIDRPVTLDVWSAEQLRGIPPGRSAARVAAYVVPTAHLAEAVGRRVEPHLVIHVPMGVVVPDKPRNPPAAGGHSLSLAIIGSGQDTLGPRAMLTGLSRLVNQLPQVHACLELRGPHEHEIWRHARRLDLLGHISAIVDAARHRPLLTGCDVLVVPERIGQVRSIILQAMGLGMPVVAADDPTLDMLVDDETACLVEPGEADQWAETLRRVLTDADVAAGLGRRARSWVVEHHRPQDQVARLAGALEQVVSGGAHTFKAAL